MVGKRTRHVRWFSRDIAFLSVASAWRTFGKRVSSTGFFSSVKIHFLIFPIYSVNGFLIFLSFFSRDLTNFMHFILSRYDHWYQTSVGIARYWASSDHYVLMDNILHFGLSRTFNLKRLMINYTFPYKLDKMRVRNISFLRITKRFFAESIQLTGSDWLV